MKHCSTCTCGLIHVEWSDRSGYVDLDSKDSIVNTILSCVFDHSYDRTNSGIPYGFPDKYEEKLAPVIKSIAIEHFPEWFNKTVYPTDEQRDILKNALLEKLKSI